MLIIYDRSTKSTIVKICVESRKVEITHHLIGNLTAWHLNVAKRNFPDIFRTLQAEHNYDLHRGDASSFINIGLSWTFVYFNQFFAFFFVSLDIFTKRQCLNFNPTLEHFHFLMISHTFGFYYCLCVCGGVAYYS